MNLQVLYQIAPSPSPEVPKKPSVFSARSNCPETPEVFPGIRGLGFGVWDFGVCGVLGHRVRHAPEMISCFLGVGNRDYCGIWESLGARSW